MTSTTTSPPKDFGFFQRKSQAYASLPVRFNRDEVVENNRESKFRDHPESTSRMCPSIDNESNDDLSDNKCPPSPIENGIVSEVPLEFECNIDDCLQDLDDYLEEIDKNSLNSKCNDDDYDYEYENEGDLVATSNRRDNNENHEVAVTAEAEANACQLLRQHPLRKTVDYRQMRKEGDPDQNYDFTSSRLWRCNSAKDLTISMPTTISSLEEGNPNINITHNTAVNRGILTQDHIFNNFLNQCNQEINQGPRQLGRRATGQPTVLNNRTPNEMIEFRPTRSLNITSTTASPQISIPESTPRRQESLPIDVTASFGSETSSFHSTRNSSPVSLASTSNTSLSSNATSSHIERNLSSTTTNGGPQTSIESNNDPPTHHDETTLNPQNLNSSSASPNSKHESWPHALSQSFALVSCTLGLFNLCRFGVLTINYGGNFVLQFILLSLLFGIPLLWLQMCLGAKIKRGPVALWRICPICKGIGISLVIVHFIVAIYSSVAVSWLFVYLRDTLMSGSRFPGSNQRWDFNNDSVTMQQNFSQDFTKVLGSYFSYIVLQRKPLIGSATSFKVNEKLAFYLAILWTSIFLILCKGLKLFGRLVYIIGFVPFVLLAVVAVKLITIVEPANIQNIFSSTDLDDFLINSQTWAVAAQEAFLTWGFLGPSVISVTSRVHAKANKTTLRKNAIFVVLTTLLGLAMMALIGLCCLHILEKENYAYVPGSYENPETYAAVFYKPTMDVNVLSFPKSLVPHYSSFVGEIYRRPFTISMDESGYQALRFITEIFPASAVLSKGLYTWPWVTVTFIMFLSFGLSQLCIMWKPISSAMGNSTTAVLLSCVTGLLLSIPFATESGINLIYYADLIFGASWIVPILWTALIFGVFLIRGRPYNGDDLVNDLKMSTSISAYLALAWNILLPIGLPALAVIDYKTSNSNQFYVWRERSHQNFSYQWARKVGAAVQTIILLLTPVVAIIQIIRYLRSGPPDILDRFQLLFRPNENGTQRQRANRNNNQNSNNNGTQSSGADASNPDDNPPKYTPPPSYTTATGARLAKMLHQSIRRSVRRILRTSRPPVFETERQIIISDFPNRQTVSSTNYEENTEESFVQPVVEMIPNNQFSSDFMSDEPPIRPRCHKRPMSAPRILQNVAAENATVRDPLRIETFFRSNECLTLNAAPLGQSQPPNSSSPVRVTIHNIQQNANASADHYQA